MQKVNTILIIIIYLASILFISIFGMKVKMFVNTIPVESVECLNETDEYATVTQLGDKKFIVVPFNEEGETTLYLNCRVLPDDASNKKLRYSYGEKFNSAVTTVLDNQGYARGVFKFHKRVVFDLTIYATDGSEAHTTVKIKVI